MFYSMFDDTKRYNRKILIGNVWDSESTEFFPGYVEIDGEKISAVGGMEELPDVTDALVLKHTDGFILPGLIETHNHLYLDFGPFATVTMRPDVELIKSMLRNAQTQLHDGVTAQRDCGTPHYLDIEVRNMIESGIINGPTLLTSGEYITATNGHGSMEGYCIIANGVEECRKAVRTLVHHQVDFIKLFITGGTASKACPPDFCYFSEAEIKAVVEEARHNGKAVCVHSHGGPGIDMAVKAGAEFLEHCSMVIDDEQIDLIAKHNCMMMFNNGARFAPPNPNLPKFEQERVAKTRETCCIAVSKALAAGIDIGVGADGHQEDYSLVWAMEGFVKSGASTRQAITAATKTPGKRLFKNERGSLAVGKYADVIITDHNPIDNISNLRKMHTVIHNGTIVRRDYLTMK